MKRCLSLVLALIISVSVVLYCSSAVYSAAVEEYLIEEFVETGIDLIRENDADKEFEPEEIECETDDEDDSSLQIINDNFSEAELPDIAFQTCRLIVKATKVPDKLNSIGVASGFKNWYIVQFENEEDAKEAYNIYLQDKSVLSVSPDRVYKSLDDITDEVETDVGEPTNSSVDCLNSQGSIYTGLYETKKYIEENSNSNTELVVGIVDTGVYLSNEFLSGKIVRTYFNACSDGYPDSEQADYARHSTEVGSIIVDNTPDNIKLAFYRSIDDTGNSSPAILALGIIAAVEDEVDVINTSFGSYDRSGILEDSVNEAISKGIVVISSAGNNHKHVMTRNFRFPACVDGVITVGSSNSEGFYPSYFTNYGECVDILAPGENVPCAYKENQYGTCSGTSFSAPYVVSLFLQLKTMYPDLDNKSIERKIYASAFKTDLLSDCELYGYGIIDAIGAFGLERTEKPIFSLSSGSYLGAQTISISSDTTNEIYYTTDQSFPSKENGILYSEPIEIKDDNTIIKAVSYSTDKYRSEIASELYQVYTLGTDDEFEITEDGEITSYSGSENNLKIPDKIKGITVKSLAPDVFSESEFTGILLPETLETISTKSFEENNHMQFLEGNGVKVVEEDALYSCSALMRVTLPQVEIIEGWSFAYCKSLSQIEAPKCLEIGIEAFYCCTWLRKAYLPSVKFLGYQSFTYCTMLTEFYAPKLKELEDVDGYLGSGRQFQGNDLFRGLDFPELENLPGNFLMYSTRDGFSLTDESYLSRLELSNVKYIVVLPVAVAIERNVTVRCVLPSTLEYCADDVFNYEPIDHVPKDLLKIYGSKGTYAESWALTHEFEFIEISQETAVINDLPDEYYDYMRYLFADVVGFNRTYQWYGSYTDSNSGGIPIEGATERKFVPKDFQQYPYYYCKVVSTDVGYDPIEIKTGATKYMDYSGEIPSADYSRLDEVLATIPDNLSVYTDESVAVLNGTLNEIDRNLDASSQDLINEYINNVKEAIASLRLKKYKITFVIDENTKYEYLLEYGEKITLPEDPQKEDYIFKGWTEGVSDTMPACDLTVFAIFEKQGNPSVKIKNYVETRTVCFKTTIIFTAETNDLPDDAAVVWYENGELVECGNKVAKLRATKDFTIQAKVIDNDGNVISESAVENVKVKHTFIAKLIAFFKMLFGRLPVIEQ